MGNKSLIDQLQMSVRSLWWDSYLGITTHPKGEGNLFYYNPNAQV